MSRSYRAPFFAGLLIRVFLHADAQEALVGDMREEYARRADRDGVGRAWMWYWRETFSALINYAGARPGATRMQGDSYMRSFLGDLRLGVRSLLSAPLSTTLSILTLAIGIGAIGAVFSVVNPILLRPLPYAEPERLVFAWELDQEHRINNVGFTTIADLRTNVPSLRDAAAMGSWTATISGTDTPERVNGQRVSWNYFRVLGVHPAFGRDFAEAEDAPGQRVVMLSHGLWRRRFGNDTSIVGRTIELDGEAHVVAGIMGPEFENVTSPTAELWRTLTYVSTDPYACRTCRHLRMLARLPAGVSERVANEELNAATASLFERYPKEYSSGAGQLVQLKARMTAPYKDALYVLFAAAFLLGLIATANVVNLQLGRAMQRENAIAVRMMLGASRARITRLLLAEGLVLAAVSGGAGMVLARVFVPMFAARLPAGIPRLASVRVDTATVMLLVGIAFAIAVIVALLPALRMTGRHLGSTLRLAQRVVGHGSAMLRRTLVVAEVALALMLLVGAGLLSRTMSALLSVDAGMNATNLLTMEIQATGERYGTASAVWDNHARVIEAVWAIPGVTSAGVSNQLALSGSFDSYGVRAFDKPLDNPELAPSADRYAVSPGFLKAMGTRIVRGRGFTEADNRRDAAPVTLVSRALAEHIWPGEDAIGKRIQVGDARSPWREVVGITENVHHRALESDATEQFYVPERQWPWSDDVVSLAVRTTGDPMALMPAIRSAVRSVDAAQPIMKVMPMTDVVARSVGQRKLALTLFGVFAALAVLLAAGGVYGVLATAITARSREIGVRAALGASPTRLIGMVARDSAWLVASGTVLGLLGVVALSGFLRSMLFGVGPNDPATIAGVTIAVAVAAMCAAILPALRAARTDPVQVLRGD